MIIGKTGQVAWELRRCMPLLGDVECISRPEVDLANPDSLRAAMRAFCPNVLINAAAYTAVDRAESEPELAMKINGEAPGVIAEEMKRLRGLMVHYSTDFVYDGSGTEPWFEDSPTGPQNVYGAAKLAGDKAVQAVGGAYLIFRTSWVYAARGRNFLRTILRLLETANPLRIVNDQIGSPTWSRDIASATLAILAQLEKRAERSQLLVSVAAEQRGIYHMSSGGCVSWHDFAAAILEQWNRQGLNKKGLLPHLEAITSAEYPSAARRPFNSRLSNAKLQSTFGTSLPHWRDSTYRVMEELAEVSSSRPTSV